ncbi:MAG: hypothetical protein K2Y51_20355 [Gammaproteobacteria bacterium]|nr:hypothetical protein [Gammaproteobacteria bacterium]
MRFDTWLRVVLAGGGVLGVLIYAFILVIDPYQVVPFAPALPRAPISTNQRFSYPAIARSAAFDSAVIGTSTMRLIDPARLSAGSGARFANLAMNSATAYEQARMLELFMRHHPAARALVIGNDGTWCNRRPDVPQYTFRAFPEWMFDDDPWNDLLYLFNDKALEDAVRMAEYLAGRRGAKYRPDGYRDFTLDFGPRDPRAAHKRLFKARPRPAERGDAAPRLEHPNWRFPLLDRLAARINALPANTRVVLVYPPVHDHYLQTMAVSMGECKARAAGLLAGRHDLVTLDYMRPTALTRDEDNFWDAVHTTSDVARMLEEDIRAVWRGETPPSPHVVSWRND